QTLSGLFAVDVDGIESGPLSGLVDFDQGRVAASIHHISFTVLQLLVLVHVLAIVFYFIVRRRNLTWTMIVGTQPVADGEEPVAVARVGLWRLALALFVASATTWWIAGGARL
ncbi:MAG TPA: Ni/Fe-hydrogenase 1 b-type cytochrome subunit, partial [Sphingomonas sp.]|nr:Ni/Fe-hydrogenase 1 b-type cytochrome subunit [Sphingomonas sp.]